MKAQGKKLRQLEKEPYICMSIANDFVRFTSILVRHDSSNTTVQLLRPRILVTLYM